MKRVFPIVLIVFTLLIGISDQGDAEGTTFSCSTHESLGLVEVFLNPDSGGNGYYADVTVFTEKDRVNFSRGSPGILYVDPNAYIGILPPYWRGKLLDARGTVANIYPEERLFLIYTTETKQPAPVLIYNAGNKYQCILWGFQNFMPIVFGK